MLDTQEECIALLEKLRWDGQPRCPYCDSIRAAPFKLEQRYHCNDCFTSYSVTVNTLFHRTRVDLAKWFQAIHLLLNEVRKVSARQLAQEINVNKNTASYMKVRIRQAKKTEDLLLNELSKHLKATYIKLNNLV
ncbi:MAG: transposase [Leptolyngbya sp.]|nr:MAG: transposase [Leptolyngbya sp.]